MFTQIALPIVDLLNQLMGPLLAIVGALGSLYCVVLGVKYAKAEEPQAREQAKEALKNAIVGFMLIFILVLALNLLMPSMINWVNTQVAGTLPNVTVSPGTTVTTPPATTPTTPTTPPTTTP